MLRRIWNRKKDRFRLDQDRIVEIDRYTFRITSFSARVPYNRMITGVDMVRVGFTRWEEPK